MYCLLFEVGRHCIDKRAGGKRHLCPQNFIYARKSFIYARLKDVKFTAMPSKQEELEWTPAIKIEKQTCNNRPLQKCSQFIISEYVEYFWAHITTPT